MIKLKSLSLRICESEIKVKLHGVWIMHLQIKVHLIFISWNGIRSSLTTSGNLDAIVRARMQTTIGIERPIERVQHRPEVWWYRNKLMKYNGCNYFGM